MVSKKIFSENLMVIRKDFFNKLNYYDNFFSARGKKRC